MFSGHERWYWVMLDPTPADESLEAAADANAWWNSSQWSSRQLFKDLVLNYSPDRRDRAVEMVWEAVSESSAAIYRRLTADGIEGARARLIATIVFAAGVMGFVLIGRRLTRRWTQRRRAAAAKSQAIAFYQRMLAMLARGNCVPTTSQTSQEFALASAPKLPDANAASLVNRVTAFYYRVRFGEVPLSPEESKQINDELTLLAARLADN
jgi:hypothetical protein